jgi:hypothetical protein
VSYQRFVQALASFSVPVLGKIFYTNVKITNPANSKSVTVPMLVDTGAANSRLDGTRYATALGLKIENGPSYTTEGVSITSKEISYRHMLQVQIGNLKPITGPVFVTTTKPLFNNLGWNGILEKYQVMVQPTKLTYTELAQAALGNAQAYFRSRV